jgi:hypothetical protein
MKLTSIELRGLSTIGLYLVNAWVTDPYVLKAAEGLGPPEVNVYISQVMNLDGYFKGRQTQYREIVLTIGLNQNYKDNISASDLRTELYGLLTAGANDAVDVAFYNENYDEVMSTSGYIKKMEIVPFSESPEVQVTISCLKSYFEGPNKIYVETGLTGSQPVENQGTAETGFELKVLFVQEDINFVITDSRGNTMAIHYDFLVDDLLYIDTRPGSRTIKLRREGGYETIIHALSMDSQWMWLYGGTTYLSTSNGSFEWEEISYTPKYWGI